MSIEIGNVIITCDICLCEFERPATPLVAPFRSWSAYQAVKEANEKGWVTGEMGVNCPGCFKRRIELKAPHD